MVEHSAPFFSAPAMTTPAQQQQKQE